MIELNSCNYMWREIFSEFLPLCFIRVENLFMKVFEYAMHLFEDKWQTRNCKEMTEWKMKGNDLSERYKEMTD